MFTTGSLASSEISDSYDYSKTIDVGIANAPPIIIIEPGQPPTGMMIDYLNEVATLERWKINWVIDEWPVIDQKIRQGEIDLITFMAYSDERAQFVDFSKEGFVTEWGQVYVKDQQAYQSILDFDQKTVAIMEGEIHGTSFTELCTLFEISCNYIVVDGYQSAFEMLSSGAVDGLACSNIVGYVYESKFDVHRSGIMYQPQKTLFAVPKNQDDQLLATLDGYLMQWRNQPNSFYHQIHDKWINQMESSVLPLWLIYLVVITVTLLLVSWLVLVILRMQIRKHVGEISDQKDQISQIINLIPHMIYAVNEKGQVILANEHTVKYFGVEGIDQAHIDDMQSRIKGSEPFFRDDQFLLSEDAKAIKKEITTPDKDLHEKVFKLSKVPFVGKNSKMPSIVTVAIDVTEEKQHEKQIQHMVQHDVITGLPNRFLLEDRIKQSHKLASQYSQHAAVMCIDLDHFKKVNDSLGHKVGDQLLIEVGKRLVAVVRPGDTVARVGGDEFVVQMNSFSSDLSRAEELICEKVDQIVKTLSRDYAIKDDTIHISASIGVVIYPKKDQTRKQILQRADTAMRYAKFKGGDCFAVFNDSMEREVNRQLVIEEELRRAINNSEFILQYQPQIDARENRLIGVEALIRWQHPNGDTIQPDDFIGVAENSGLIIPMGLWVLENACRQISHWVETYGQSPFITVNLSVIQILNSNFVESLEEMLEKYQIPPHLIELEVTESVMLKETSVAIEVLNQIKKLGVRLSIDDFGTGYSSLNYLKKLPFDKLKIDRSFVKDIPGDYDNETIIKSIITISTDLGLELIAEGVETKEQVELLMKMNCDHFQGFYFDKPNSIEYINQKYLQ